MEQADKRSLKQTKKPTLCNKSTKRGKPRKWPLSKYCTQKEKALKAAGEKGDAEKGTCLGGPF